MKHSGTATAAIILAVALALVTAAASTLESTQNRRARIEQALADPFRGVTTNGQIVSDLFSIQSTGVTTAPIKKAAESYLRSLNDTQRAQTHYPVDDLEWRKWNNVHRAERQGTPFEDMNDTQKSKAFGLLEVSLSAKGLKTSQNIMKLNQHLGELVHKPDEYGEGLYHITIMGEPSMTEPWGWQLEGHHLIINYFVLGDQVVMSPSFMGSEPVIGTGAYEGIEILQDEQNRGLAFMLSLSPEEQSQAVVSSDKGRSNALAQAYNDNLVLDYAGISAGKLDAKQKEALLEVIEVWVAHMRGEHARVRMAEVRQHIDDTYFAWIGETTEDSVFYYRIQSPVILVEFDHQGPIALEGPKVPSRRHVHTVVRTPNGNDYGKDLLRQHLEIHSDDAAHGHAEIHPHAVPDPR